MKALLLPLIALAALPVMAQYATTPAPEPETKEIHFVQTPQGRIELHQDRGPCQGHAKRAAYVAPNGESVGGCWITQGQVVGLVFLDGDVARIPIAALQKSLAA